MCELCGCEAVRSRTRSAKAQSVEPTLAAIPVKVLPPDAESIRSARRRQRRTENQSLRQSHRTA